MHRGRNTCIIQSPRIERAVADLVDGVIPGLQQECGRRAPGDVDSGIEPGTEATQVAGIHRDGKAGAAAVLIARIDRPVSRLADIAGLRHEIPARRRTDHPNLVRMVGVVTSNTAADVCPSIASGVGATSTLSAGCAIRQLGEYLVKLQLPFTTGLKFQVTA